MRDDRRYSSCGSNLACVNHDAELHERGVDRAGALSKKSTLSAPGLDLLTRHMSAHGVHDVDVIIANTLANDDTRLAGRCRGDGRLCERDAQPATKHADGVERMSRCP